MSVIQYFLKYRELHGFYTNDQQNAIYNLELQTTYWNCTYVIIFMFYNQKFKVNILNNYKTTLHKICHYLFIKKI